MKVVFLQLSYADADGNVQRGYTLSGQWPLPEMCPQPPGAPRYTRRPGLGQEPGLGLSVTHQPGDPGRPFLHLALHMMSVE